jgi:L-fuconolactonase
LVQVSPREQDRWTGGLIDTHGHIWRIERVHETWRPPLFIDRSFGVSDIVAAGQARGLAAIVLVESGVTNEDNAWLANAAAAHPSVMAFIAYGDPLADDLEHSLDWISTLPKARGVRFRLEGSDPSVVLDPRFGRALLAASERGLLVELLIQPVHLPAVARVLDVTGVAAVIEHMAKPPLLGWPSPAERTAWEAGMAEIAALPMTICKLSISPRATEMAGWADQSAVRVGRVHLREMTTYLLDWFGPQRCVWGSDWPIASLTGSYEDVLNRSQDALPDLSAADARRIFEETAQRVYGNPLTAGR